MNTNELIMNENTEQQQQQQQQPTIIIQYLTRPSQLRANHKYFHSEKGLNYSRNYQKERYHNDPVYRAKSIEKAKLRYLRKKTTDLEQFQEV
jgi:hypothetical protein